MTKLLLILCLVCTGSVASAQLKVGELAPEISLPNTNDSVINLSSLRGKVVLIDFWASWCGPCRASNPGLKKVHKKFKDQGFEIYSVSIDNKKAEWLKAIKKDKLNFTMVMDGDGWYSKVAERYFIDEIPTSFLLDKTGTIIAINLDGKRLADKIEMLLNL